MQTLQATPRPNHHPPRNVVVHYQAPRPRPNRDTVPRTPFRATQQQENHQIQQNQYPPRPRPRYSPRASVVAPRTPRSLNQPPAQPAQTQGNSEGDLNIDIFNHLGDLAKTVVERIPQRERSIELVDDPIEFITTASIFGMDDDEDESKNTHEEIKSDPTYPIKAQYERTIQQLISEKNQTEHLLHSKIKVFERRITDLEKYEQLIEECSFEQIQQLSLEGCTNMKNKVKNLLFALEHEEVKLTKEKIRRDCYEDLYFCLICQEKERNVSFDPCGHFCLCYDCVESKKVTTCPICRAHITEKRRTYLG